MKRRNRDVVIFSLSALDVLAMSTGVFVLLLVMLMPYYRKEFDANAAIEAVLSSSADLQADIEDMNDAAAEARSAAAALATAAARLDAQARQLEASAAEDQASAAGAPPPPRKADVQADQRVVEELDLVFVIDTTSSMTPVIRELAETLVTIVTILERLVPSVRVAVVAYKDRDTGLAPVTVLPLTDTAYGFRRVLDFVQRLDASRVGSSTLDEDVHLGLAAATQLPLRPDARQALVVIGDAAAHSMYRNETFVRARNFINVNSNRTISTLFVPTPLARRFGLSARPYFQKLAAAGGGTFHDHTGSMVESVLLSVLVEET